MSVWTHDELATTAARMLGHRHAYLAAFARRAREQQGDGVLTVTFNADRRTRVSYIPMARYREYLAAPSVAVARDAARTVLLATGCDAATEIVVEFVGSPVNLDGRLVGGLVFATLAVVLRLDGAWPAEVPHV